MRGRAFPSAMNRHTEVEIRHAGYAQIAIVSRKLLIALTSDGIGMGR